MGVIVLRYACVFLMGSFKKHSIYPLGNLTSESLLLVLRSFVISQDICLTQPSKSIGVGFHVSLSELDFMCPFLNSSFTCCVYRTNVIRRSMALSGVPVPLVIRDVPRCLRKPTSF